MAINEEIPFVYQFTEQTFVVTADMGIKMISMVNRSSTNGSFTTNRQLGEFTSNEVTLFEDKPATLGSNENQTSLDGITIVAPAGCLLQIMAI